MIKLLQKKFVVTAMIAITVLIVIMLGTINVVNIISVKTQIDNHLYMISENSAKPFEVPREYWDIPKGNGEMKPRLDGDRIQASPFFTVNCDQEGNIIHYDSTRIPSLSNDTVKSYTKEVLTRKQNIGRIGNYKYLVSNRNNLSITNIVFLDTYDEFYAYVRVLGLSVVIGLASWGGMLIFVMFLSKKAIKPIAKSMEKQKQFVTNAGHEIKTPLAIIQTNAEALELYQGESKWSNNIKQQTIRLSELMKNLLQLSKMDENDIAIKKEEFNLPEIVGEQLLLFEELFFQNGLAIEQKMSFEGNIYGNREQVIQMVAILLDNANKYAKKDSTISIIVEKQGHHERLIIENECDQLPAEEPERLFDRFYRADKARTQKAGGYGIGLSLAKAIAESNKYTIKCIYPTEDKIRFMITF